MKRFPLFLIYTQDKCKHYQQNKKCALHDKNNTTKHKRSVIVRCQVNVIIIFLDYNNTKSDFRYT